MYCTGNTIDLAEGTNAEETDTDAEEGENLCEPFKIFAHAEFNIVEGPPRLCPSSATVRYLTASRPSEYLVAMPRNAATTIQNRAPGPACTNRRCDTDDISGTDCCTQCGTECGEAGNFAFSAFLILKHPFQCEGKLTNLEQTEADGQ